jgi:hypothetical protein
MEQTLIKGRVVSCENGSYVPLPYARVQLIDTVLEATTNALGIFWLLAPEGNDPNALRVTVSGYGASQQVVTGSDGFVTIYVTRVGEICIVGVLATILQDLTPKVVIPPGVGTGQDEIVLANDLLLPTTLPHLPDLSTETVVLIDAHVPDESSECANDMVRGTSGLQFTNLKNSQDCEDLATDWPYRDEIVVFSVDNPVAFQDGGFPTARLWSDMKNEAAVVDLGLQLVQVPVAVWVAHRDPVNATAEEIDAATADAVDIVKSHFQKANSLYNLNRAGIIFDTTVTFVDEWTQIGERPDSAFWCDTPFLHIDSSRLNVYYVPSIKGERMGYHFSESDSLPCGRNVILVDFTAPTTTLAHEIGHALSLEHTGSLPCSGGDCSDGSEYPESSPPFNSYNLMWTDLDSGQAEDRSLFSLGQVFRMRFESVSWLSIGNLVSEGTRMCQCKFDDCPSQYHDLSDRAGGICPRVSQGWQ